MRTIERTVYKFSELSENAKHKVRQEMRDCLRDTDLFYESYKDRLQENFEQSNLDLQFSFSCCQGDGVNVYGTLVLSDFAKLILQDFEQYISGRELTEKEIDRYKRFLGNIQHESGFANIKLECNSRYTYSLKNQNNFVEDTKDDIINALYNYWISIDSKTDKIITLFVECLQDYLIKFEADVWRDGYSYFLDDIDDSEIISYCDDLDIEFYADGERYC